MYVLDRDWFGSNLVKKNHFSIISTLNGLSSVFAVTFSNLLCSNLCFFTVLASNE